jgi:membrane-associated phospholipid phosphatase
MTESHPINLKIIGIYLSLLLVATATIRTVPQLDFIAAWQKPEDFFTVTVFQFFSDTVNFFSMGIPLLIALVVEFKKETNKKRSRLALLYVLLSIAVGGLISFLMKKTFLEPRPYEVDPRIIQLSVGGGYSLPSGHTTEAFASAVALTILFPRWFVFVPMFCWASLVAMSRIYLGVHYPFDILVGMIIGSTVSFTLYFLVFRKYISHS